MHFEHVGGCTYPTSGTCTCGANLPLIGDIWMDSPYHPYADGPSYHDPSGHRRVGPRGGLRRMSHDRPEDVDSLRACVRVVARGPANVLALCDRPRYQHPGHEERIR